MLRPTDNLRSDHSVVTLGLSVLAAMARRVRSGGAFPAAEVAVVLRFLREFVLAIHMRKENDHVCPAVAMRGDDRAATLVGELLRMHEEARDLVHALVLFWEPVGDLSIAEREGFADAAEALVARTLRMQAIEEAQLFPACDAVVPPDDQLDWITAFEQLETERGSRAVWSRRIGDLARNWLA
ncbi:MAG TPA: hemerythrin domain-containing protein [Planctomycetota bacterium]|nr:hemerythrin domain-containing protein [Planctomycetota bacterium]